MKNYGFIFMCLFSSRLLFAQIEDSFSDGNLSDPDWSGSTGQFIINGAQQLQLNNSAAGSSFLSTPLPLSSLDNFEWRVFIKEAFAPSGSNYGRIYLTSSESDLTKPLNGYYLQFGETGSNDAVQLFQQTGSISTSVCRAKNGGISSSFSLRIKVLRNESGSWELWIDYAGGANFTLEASGSDETYSNSSFFGLSCTYTSSNATKFYFDDVYAGPRILDTIPPVLETIQAVSGNALTLIFSEPLDQASAESLANYSAGNNLGYPQTAKLQSDLKAVSLVFAVNFPNGIQNKLDVSAVRDLAGNTMTPAELSFLYFQPAPVHAKDIIITEIFPDPVPQIGLPNAEFIEIYNRSVNPVDLNAWKLSDGVSTLAFSPQVVLPGQYWIVTALTSASAYAPFGNVISAGTFLTLNNGADTLTLKNQEGVTIDSLNYSLDWYHDPDKEQGGWTLELIDLNNSCGAEENWAVSENPLGGTPGKENSIIADKPDRTGPMLLGAIPNYPDGLLLTFNEKLDSSAVAGRFTLIPAIPLINSRFANRSLREIQLRLESPLSTRQVYTLKVGGILDCNQNEIQEDFSEIHFALPELADSLDVVINEILFNPRPNGTDFVEVYNQSPKYINLRNWRFANFTDHVLENLQEITNIDLFLAPGDYLAVTADPVLLKNNYPQGKNENFLESTLPGMPDDSGSIALVNEQGKVMDSFVYNKSFHSDLIKDDEGVSLERLLFSGPTNDRQNWKSASSQSGFATPGYINSNSRPETSAPVGNVSIDPEIFVPNSGTRDFATINYNFEQAGYIANIKILDQQGHQIKVISNNETLGFAGFFRWDGDRDDGVKARMGYYIVWIEVFDVSGKVNLFRKRVVIATR